MCAASCDLQAQWFDFIVYSGHKDLLPEHPVLGRFPHEIALFVCRNARKLVLHKVRLRLRKS